MFHLSMSLHFLLFLQFHCFYNFIVDFLQFYFTVLVGVKKDPVSLLICVNQTYPNSTTIRSISGGVKNQVFLINLTGHFASRDTKTIFTSRM